MAKRARRTMIALGLFGCLGVLVHHELPEIVEWKLRRELAARGLPEARFRVVSVELDRIELADVELGPGLALGTVEIDGGISLLWSDPGVVSIRGARVRGAALAGLDGPSRDHSLRELRVTDSVVELDGNLVSVAGTIELGVGRPIPLLTATAPTWRLRDRELQDLQIQVEGSRACGGARSDDLAVHACVTLPRRWSRRAELRDGHAEIRVAAWSRERVALEDAVIGLDFAGPIDAIRARGELQARHGRVETVEVADAGATLELEVSERDLRVRPCSFHARELHANAGSRAVDATEVTASFALGDLVGSDRAYELGEIAWSARQAWVQGAVLTAPRGTIGRDRTVAWRARELAVRGVTLREPSGTANDAGVRWRARELVAGEATLHSASGTIAGDGTIAWRAERGRWRDANARQPRGRIATSGEIELHADKLQWRGVEMASPSVELAHGVVRWRAPSMTRGSLALDDIAGTSRLDAGTHLVAWSAARAGKLAFGTGMVSLASREGQVSLARGAVSAYGGVITLARTTRLDSAIVLDVRGIQLDAVLRAFPGRASGTGSLDGSIEVRPRGETGELEIARFELASRTRGTFQIGDRSWVDHAVASLAVGYVAVPERIGGALADFAFTRLAVVLAPGSTLRVSVHGAGRRVPQQLDLVVNVRGLREAAQVVTRVWEAS